MGMGIGAWPCQGTVQASDVVRDGASGRVVAVRHVGPVVRICLRRWWSPVCRPALDCGVGRVWGLLGFVGVGGGWWGCGEFGGYGGGGGGGGGEGGVWWSGTV